MVTLFSVAMFATDPVTVKSTFTKATAPANNQVTDLAGVVTWNISTTVGEGEPTYATGKTSNIECIKFGASKSVYFSKVEFSTDYFTNYNVTSVKFYVANNGKKTGTLTAKQGNVTIGTASQEFGSTWTELTATGTNGAGGTLTVSYEVEQASYVSYIEVTYEVAQSGGGDPDPEPEDKTFYLTLSSDWASWPAKYAMYYFKSAETSQNGWSAFMTAVEGETNMYTGTIPTGYDKVIMVRLDGAATEPNWNSKWSQTVNLDVPTNDNDLFTVTSGGTGSECDGAWSKYVAPTPAEDLTLYLINNQEWETPTAHVFAGSASKAAWPGEAMTKTADKVNGFDVYSYTFKDNYTSIIFNDGEAQGTTQTVDLTWDKAKPYFVPGDLNNGKYEGTWYATKEEIPAPPTPVYNIAGQWDMTGEAWNFNAFNVAEDGKTGTFEVELAPGDYEFKIVRVLGEAQSWLTKQNEGAFGLHREYTGVAGVTDQANNNLKVTADEGGKYVFTWTFANDSIGITFPAKHVLSETWGVGENTAVAAGTKYVDNYAVAIETVYATTLKENARKFGSYAFTHAIQIRNAAYPSADAPQGTEQSGSTSLVITAKENVDITLFYNRQTTSDATGAAASNDGKDMKVFDQAAPTTALDAEFRVVSMQEDKKYVNAVKTVSLVKGHTYTVSAKGTTIQLSGIRYATNAEAPVAKYYIIGAGEAFGEWSHVAVYEDSYEIKDLAAGSYMFRLTMAEDDWSKDYGFAQLTVKPEGVTGNDDNNICFELRQASDFKVTYKPAAGEDEAVFTVEANFYVPVMKDIFLVPNQWAEGDAKIAAWTWNKAKTINVFTDFFAPKAENNDTLVAKVLAEVDSIIFVRFNATATEPKWNGGDGYQWNQTPDDSIQWEKAVFTILPGSEYMTNGTWDVYTPEPPATFYITGNAALVGEDLKWNAKAVKATANTYTFVGLHANTEYLLKVIEDGNWDGGKVYGYSALTEKPEGLSADSDGNVAFKLVADGDVTVTYFWAEVAEDQWEMTFKVEGNFYVPVKKDIFLVPNQWAEGDAKIAAWTWNKAKTINVFTEFFAPKAEGNDTLVAKVLAEVDSIIFVRFNATATEPKWNGGDGYQWNQTPSDSIQWEKAVFTILPGTEYMTNGTWDVYTPAQPRLADGFYLIGQKGWEVDSISADLLFAANPDNAGEYQLTVNLVKDDKIKVVKVENDVIKHWYPDGEGNEYTVDVAHEGNKTIYFKPDYVEAWADFGGYFFIEANHGTGLDKLADDAQAVKAIVNGQLFIIRGGKTYTVQGAEVR